jgi:ribosomal protein S27AE
MPSIVLKIMHAPSEMEDRELPRGAGPLFRGNGDTDYLCGNCGFVIASGLAPQQHVMLDRAACAACGAINEFPPELRS